MVFLAAASLAVIVYTYFGYPVVVAVLARLFPRRPYPSPGFEPTVTVCICVYNASAHIDRKLESTLALAYPADKLEILVYSDGSTDDTDERVRAWSARDGRIKLLRGDARMGKPTGLNKMRDAASAEVLLLTDVRQEFDPGALRALVADLSDPRMGCVSGELMLRGKSGAGLYWRYEKWIRRSESRFRSVVGISGSIAALRRTDMPFLPAELLLDDLWIPMSLRLKGRLVGFCDEARAYDEAFEDDREFPRKVRTLAGNFQIFALMPALLSPAANPSWFETVSHKLLRLACPWALGNLFVASAQAAFGGVENMGLLFLGQVLFYGAAIAGRRAGRVGALARTFVVLNAAAVVGLWRFLTGTQKVTW